MTFTRMRSAIQIGWLAAAPRGEIPFDGIARVL